MDAASEWVWAAIAAIAFILVAAYVTYRLLLLLTVRHMQWMGGSVVWDVQILPSEGGKLDENEPREITRLRRLLHARPLVVYFSDQFIGSENFTSDQIQYLQRLGFLKRLVFEHVPVRYTDIARLSRRLRIQELAVFDVELADDEQEMLKRGGEYRFTYEAPGKAS